MTATASAEAWFETMSTYIRKGRIRSCSTFLRNLLWTSARRWRGSRRHRWGCGGGNRRGIYLKGERETMDMSAEADKDGMEE